MNLRIWDYKDVSIQANSYEPEEMWIIWGWKDTSKHTRNWGYEDAGKQGRAYETEDARM